MLNKEFNARIKQKRDTSANWEARNPVILNGEIILVDTNAGELRAKIGDGTKTYTQLPFSDEALRSLINTNKVTVDSALSSTSTNPVQNKVVNAAISNLNTLVGDTSVSSQIETAAASKLDAADATWVQIYDSGTITSEVNSIAGIDITGYKSLMVAVKCVNTTNTTNTRAGAVIFTGNNQDYAFNNLFSNLIKNGTTTSGAMAKFRIVDGFIICETAMRAITADGILSDTEGAGIDTLAPVSSGLIKCTNAVTTMTVSSAAQSATHFYGVGSRVIVWGCKV
jgi:hypothetical protein